ncbi:transposase [Bradyrhizobium sp. CCBAU 65884]|uniref:transposase n=1 Tax=Bradyrhizobium sp. CCBAU 65884 TaxID=722477 RepID=UPI003FA46FE6
MSAPSSATRTFHMIEAVAGRLEGAPRLRRRWSDEFKAQVVTEALEPGASVSAIARRRGTASGQSLAQLLSSYSERAPFAGARPLNIVLSDDVGGLKCKCCNGWTITE